MFLLVPIPTPTIAIATIATTATIATKIATTIGSKIGGYGTTLLIPQQRLKLGHISPRYFLVRTPWRSTHFRRRCGQFPSVLIRITIGTIIRSIGSCIDAIIGSGRLRRYGLKRGRRIATAQVVIAIILPLVLFGRWTRRRRRRRHVRRAGRRRVVGRSQLIAVRSTMRNAPAAITDHAGAAATTPPANVGGTLEFGDCGWRMMIAIRSIRRVPCDFRTVKAEVGRRNGFFVVVVRIVVSGAWRDCRQVTRSCRHFVLFVVFRVCVFRWMCTVFATVS
mmetsp:Transcript_39561/g.82670  ORF Transcript_39561/g.82670 Transcript_39561/m.82670 type:complete len:278 (-) Transcript_39561:265-1098(-)